MPQLVALLVPATLFTFMFSLGLGLKVYPFVLLRDRPGFFWRVVLGTCLLVPLAGMLLVLLPLGSVLSKPAWTAIALMVICPSAPMILFRVSSTGGIAELAARLQIGGAVLAIVTIPLMAFLLTTSLGIQDWEIGPAAIAVQVLRVQLVPLLAGMVLSRWKPELAHRCSRVLGRLTKVLLVLMLVAMTVASARELWPFLRQNVAALACMTGLSALSLAMGYVLAGDHPKERRTVALVTGMRNTGLAAELALSYAPEMQGLVPGILSYVLITLIVSTLFLNWQQHEIPVSA